MQFVFDFIDNISANLSDFWVFTTGLFMSLTKIYQFINEVRETVVELIMTFPPWLMTFGLATVSIAIIYQILHFTQGGSKSDG